MIDRRRFIVTSAAFAAVLAAGRAGPGLAQSRGRRSPAAAALDALMERGYQELVLSDPETRTSLGLDSGAHAAAKSRLQDRSAAALRRRQDQFRQFDRQLLAIDREALSGMDAVNYDTLKAYGETVIRAYDNFSYGTHSWPEP